MKILPLFKRSSRAAYALLVVLAMITASIVIMTGTLSRTYTVSSLNNRSDQRILVQNAAEAAIEKVFTQMQYDFQSAGGLANVTRNLASYQNNCPNEDPYWANFVFSDGTATGNNKTYVGLVNNNFFGALPGVYSNRMTIRTSIYRVLSNARWAGPNSTVVGAAQEDVLFAYIPLSAYAIFYNDLMEFSTCATMVVNGPVHGNGNIYVGTGASLTFNNEVTASGTISAPANNGASFGSANTPNSSWNTYFNGVPTNYMVNVPTVQISIPMTNTHMLIDMPVTNDSTDPFGKQRLYNQAQVIMLVSNATVTMIVQQAVNGNVPGGDTTPYITTYTNLSKSYLSTNLPFLTLLWPTNSFYDKRELTSNFVAQIDVGKYASWLANPTNDMIQSKYPTGSGTYPTILYAADFRTAGSHQLNVVRLTNGTALPYNGGQGWSLATPNPLYVWGNYNQTNSALLGSANTSSGVVPASLMSDSLTVLSAHWSDPVSFSTTYSSGSSSYDATSADTVNAAILTGVVPSTGTTTTTFSGGVHNLPRLLEDWSSSTLWLNTSIINLFASTRATNKFVNPGTYYNPPTRKFSFDTNFSNPSDIPPGIPCALIAMRYNWATPPPGVTNYVVH